MTIELVGSWPALVTPLTAEGRIEVGDVEVLVARALAHGAAGVLVAGTTGEGALLTPEQRVELTRVARRALELPGAATVSPPGPGRPVLLAGASGPDVAAVHADVARLAEAGADLVLVLAPATYPLGPDELVDLHVAIADRAAVPTLVYHIPQITNASLTPEAVRQLAAHPNIVGMKDSAPDAPRRAAFVEATRDVEGFQVLTGHAPTLLAALDAGASGSITAIANIRQAVVVALHTAVQAGDRAAAERAQASLGAVSDAMTAAGTSLPAALKAALQLEGTIGERWCVAPLRSVAPDRLDHIRTALLR